MKRFLVLLAACGDGGSPSLDATVAIDGALDAPMTFATCTGACRTTAITATLAAMRTLDKAYYGVTQSPLSLHVEAYKNPPAGCPTATSPEPDYTLILGRVTIPTDTTPSTSPGSMLDFQGDLLGGPPGQSASMVTITPTAADAVTAPNGFVALDVMLTFPSGTVTGHLYATHCASMDAAN